MSKEHEHLNDAKPEEWDKVRLENLKHKKRATEKEPDNPKEYTQEDIDILLNYPLN
tara:strand:+ start:20074 stop:20241 length:168 start_codon:yes stop_codon:yes gene_type:complete